MVPEDASKARLLLTVNAAPVVGIFEQAPVVWLFTSYAAATVKFVNAPVVVMVTVHVPVGFVTVTDAPGADEVPPVQETVNSAAPPLAAVPVAVTTSELAGGGVVPPPSPPLSGGSISTMPAPSWPS